MSNEEIINNINNSSGQGENTVIPPSIKKFNFGVCVFNIYWLLWYHQVKPLVIFMILCFVPFVGWLGCLCMLIWMGTQANVWAWKTFHYESVEEFHKIHSTIAKWAAVCFFVPIVITIIVGAVIGFSVNNFMKNGISFSVREKADSNSKIEYKTEKDISSKTITKNDKVMINKAISYLNKTLQVSNKTIDNYEADNIPDYFFDAIKELKDENIGSRSTWGNNFSFDEGNSFEDSKYTTYDYYFVSDGNCLNDNACQVKIKISTYKRTSPNTWQKEKSIESDNIPIKAKKETIEVNKLEIITPEIYK